MHLHKNMSFPLIEALSACSLFISMRIHHHHHCSTWSAGSLFFMCSYVSRNTHESNALKYWFAPSSSRSRGQICSINIRHVCCDTVASRSLWWWCPCAWLVWNITGVVIGAQHVQHNIYLLWIKCRFINRTETLPLWGLSQREDPVQWDWLAMGELECPDLLCKTNVLCIYIYI